MANEVRREARRPDRFHEISASAIRWVEERRRAVVIAAIVVVVTSLAMVVHGVLGERGGDRAARLLARAGDVANAGVRGPADENEEPEPGRRMFGSVEARAKAAIKNYRAVLDASPDDGVAAAAHLGAGASLLDLGRHAEARREYDAALRLARRAGSIAAFALEGAGFALEGTGDLRGADSKYQEMQRIEGGAWKNLAEFHVARLAARQGDKPRATTLLHALLDRIRQDGAMSNLYLRERVEGELTTLEGAGRVRPGGGMPGLGMGPATFKGLGKIRGGPRPAR